MCISCVDLVKMSIVPLGFFSAFVHFIWQWRFKSKFYDTEFTKSMLLGPTLLRRAKQVNGAVIGEPVKFTRARARELNVIEPPFKRDFEL